VYCIFVSVCTHYREVHHTGYDILLEMGLRPPYSEWAETESTWYCGHYWPIVPDPDDRCWWLWSNWWNEDWQGKPKCSEKTCPSATLSTTNPTWLDPGSNPGHRGGKPVTNHLSNGTVLCVYGALLVVDALKVLCPKKSHLSWIRLYT
jgi:hypothetical protein